MPKNNDNGETFEKTSVVASDDFKGRLRAANGAPPVVVLMGPSGYQGKHIPVCVSVGIATKLPTETEWSQICDRNRVTSVYMQMKYIILCMLFFPLVGLADPEIIERPFKAYQQQGQITPYLQIANFSFYAGAPDIHGKAYVPNFSTLAGLRLGWKEYLISSSFALPIPKEEIDRRGKSDQFNFVVNKYWQQSAVDLYYQKYRGFYAGNPANELNLSKPERFTQFPNARSVNYGLNYYYALNENEYSFKSAFAFKEEQLRSGGSPLIHMFYNHVELSLGDTIIPGTESDAIQTMPLLQNVALETGGAGYGYGYTWILDRFIATAQIVAAAGLQSKSGTANSDLAKSVYTGALKGNANFSVAYHFDEGLVGLRFLMDSLCSNANGEQIYSTFMVGTLFYLNRF